MGRQSLPAVFDSGTMAQHVLWLQSWGAASWVSQYTVTQLLCAFYPFNKCPIALKAVLLTVHFKSKSPMRMQN